MGAAVNKDNFLGTMLPNVKITKITLDNTYTDGQIGKADDHTVTGRQITIKAEFYEQIDNNGNLSYLSASGFENIFHFEPSQFAENTVPSPQALHMSQLKTLCMQKSQTLTC